MSTKTETGRYKDLLKKISSFGTEVIEEVDLPWLPDQVVKRERILILLDMLYHKATREQSIQAAREVLDRLLGKPKESLNLTNGSDLIGKLSDDELIEKIAGIFKAHTEGGAGESD